MIFFNLPVSLSVGILMITNIKNMSVMSVFTLMNWRIKLDDPQLSLLEYEFKGALRSLGEEIQTWNSNIKAWTPLDPWRCAVVSATKMPPPRSSNGCRFSFQPSNKHLIQISCVLAWLESNTPDSDQVCCCLVGMKTCSHSGPLLDQFDTTALSLVNCEVGPPWIGLVCPAHPTNARLDWDLGNLEAKSTP